MLPQLAWALVTTGVMRDTKDGELLTRDGRLPLFWYRKVAKLSARRWGFTPDGQDRDVRVVRVRVTQAVAKDSAGSVRGSHPKGRRVETQRRRKLQPVDPSGRGAR